MLNPILDYRKVVSFWCAHNSQASTWIFRGTAIFVFNRKRYLESLSHSIFFSFFLSISLSLAVLYFKTALCVLFRKSFVLNFIDLNEGNTFESQKWDKHCNQIKLNKDEQCFINKPSIAFSDLYGARWARFSIDSTCVYVYVCSFFCLVLNDGTVWLFVCFSLFRLSAKLCFCRIGQFKFYL